MRFDALWGLVNDSYENFKGFYTTREKHLWLPAGPSSVSFGALYGFDALAAASAFTRHLGYPNPFSGYHRDYSGKYDYTTRLRFRQLSDSNITVAQIPSLIITDGLAGTLVGTKTAFSNKGAPWPATMASDATNHGSPALNVTVIERVIRYDMRYAVPGLIILVFFVVVLVWMVTILVRSRSILRNLRYMYNHTSTGRLATGLLSEGEFDASQPTKDWVESEGQRRLTFGHEKVNRSGSLAT